MNDQNKTSWEPILNETDLEKRLQLVRDLVNSDDDRAHVEERLLRVFAEYLPDKLRTEVESSLLKLRGGSVDESGYQVSDATVHLSIYEDTWKLNPSSNAAAHLLWQARQWRNPQTAIWVAKKFLETRPQSYQCSQALTVLVENNELDPAWFLEYVKSHCIPQDHGGWGSGHAAAVANALNSNITQQWDDDDRLEAVDLFIAPFCKTLNDESAELVEWILSNFHGDKTITALQKLLSLDVDPRLTSYLPPLGRLAVPAVVSFLQASQRNLSPGIEVGFELGLKMDNILNALSDNPNYPSVGEALAELVAERERDFVTELRQLNPDRYRHLKRCAEAWFRFRAEQILHEAAQYVDYRRHGSSEINEHFARAILSIARQLYDSSRGPGKLLNTPVLSLPGELPRNLTRNINHLRPLVTLFGPGDDINLDSLTGLALPEPPSFEYDDALRFQYLAEFGRTTDGEPLDKLIVDYTGEDLGKLIDLEKQRDGALDELAYVRSQAEKRRQEGSSESWKGDDGPRDGFDFDKATVEIEHHLYSARFDPLIRASEKALLPLAERGVKFQRMEPEGLLGEFRPTDNTARIYTGMIRLLASSPEMRAFPDSAEVESALRRIAEIHEAVHGQIILAQTCDRKHWENYQSSPFLLHETIATAYTRRFITQLQANQFLLSVLDTLESMLPWEYQGAVLLQAFSGEELRRFVLLARTPDDSMSPVATMSKVFQILHEHALLLAATMPVFEYDDLRERISEISDEVRGTTDGLVVTEACTDGLRSLGMLPTVKAICEMFGGFKWPDEVQLTYWDLIARNDGAVGDDTLRLHVARIRHTSDTSAVLGLTDLHNTAALGLPHFKTDDPDFRILRSRIRESTDESEEDDK